MGAIAAKLRWRRDEQPCETSPRLRHVPVETQDQPSSKVLKDVPPEKLKQPCKDELLCETAFPLKDIPAEKMDQPSKDEDLCEIALAITDWQSMAPFLGLTEAQESEIKEDSDNARVKKIKMLRKWRNKLGEKATYRKLAEILLKLGETGAAENLCKLLQSSTPEGASRNVRCHYANSLREMYQSGVPTFLSLQWPPPPTYKVFNLAMISHRPLRYGSDDELVSLLQKGNVCDVVDRRGQVTLEEISHSMHSNDRNFILIEGAPGAGKSTLAWHLCTKWEAEELFQNFEIVLFVQLREPAIQSAKSLEDLLPAESLNMKKEVVSAIQYCNGRKVLIILDSWDEFTPGLSKPSVIQNLICKPTVLKMQFSALIITSRPIATAKLQRFISRRIEIVGFQQSEIRHYFTEALGDSDILQKLCDHLRERQVIEASCCLPLNAAIITHLFLASNHTLPATLHGVFTSLVICCIKRHLERQSVGGEDIPEFSSLDSLPQGVQEHFNNLCKLAYHGVMKNKATFSGTDLESFQLRTELSTLSLMQGVASFSTLGLTKLYNFLHLSTQELLAAYYIAKMQPGEQVKVFKELFEQSRFANVFQFYAAFTGLQTEGVQVTVSSIVKSKKKLLVLSLLHCLYEAQDDTLCEFVAYELQNELDLSEQTLDPVNCLSIGYFVRRVCSTNTGEFKLKLTIDRIGEYGSSLLVRELSKYSLLHPQTATEGIANLYLELVEISGFIAEHGKIISNFGLYLKALW